MLALSLYTSRVYSGKRLTKMYVYFSSIFVVVDITRSTVHPENSNNVTTEYLSMFNLHEIVIHLGIQSLDLFKGESFFSFLSFFYPYCILALRDLGGTCKCFISTAFIYLVFIYYLFIDILFIYLFISCVAGLPEQ